jgi:hypothetical protein
MKIYVDLDLVKRLGKILKREVEAKGVKMPLSHGYVVVARMFGHDDYEALRTISSYASLSPRDDEVDAAELARRYEQYLRALGASDYTKDCAVELLEKVGVKSWWGLRDGKRIPREQNAPRPEKPRCNVRRSSIQARFFTLTIPESLSHQFGRFARRAGIELIVSRNELIAKMFGHDRYDDLVAVYGRGAASVEDWHVSPEELDRRAAEYVRVLMEAGFNVGQAHDALSAVGCMGWLGVRPDEWELGARQAAHVAAIMEGRRPTGKWRPAREVRTRTAA